MGELKKTTFKQGNSQARKGIPKYLWANQKNRLQINLFASRICHQVCGLKTKTQGVGSNAMIYAKCLISQVVWQPKSKSGQTNDHCDPIDPITTKPCHRQFVHMWTRKSILPPSREIVKENTSCNGKQHINTSCC